MDEPCDAAWLASSVTHAAVSLITLDGVVEDARGAYEACDWESVLESVGEGLLWLSHFENALAGRVSHQSETGMLATLAWASALERWFEELPPITRADQEVASEHLLRFENAATGARRKLPLDLPSIRSPAGFFPAVRLAREVEALRAQLGLPPLPWNMMV